jgi:hypothetical protein
MRAGSALTIKSADLLELNRLKKADAVECAHWKDAQISLRIDQQRAFNAC